MHDCPECGGACHCDGEDHYQPAPINCTHECDFDDDDEDDYDDEEAED